MRLRARDAIATLTFATSVCLAVPALAQPEGEAPAEKSDNPYGGDEETGQPAPAAAEETKPEGAAEAAPPKPSKEKKPAAVESTPDTRSDAMRAYQDALKARKLAATAPLSRQRLRDELTAIEAKVVDGRRDEAIGDLVTIIESPRFDPFAATDEGRTMLFQLGDALGRGGAYEPARGYLARLLKGSPTDTWYRKAVRSLVDFGLESHLSKDFLKDLEQVPAGAPDEMRGDIAYLNGRVLERDKQPEAALKKYALVSPRSRFWAQATYLSGLIEVERGRLKQGENLFCRVADPKLTPKKAPLFGGTDFFRVRDLSRLALGRVAHEQYRFDDARYYYYLVPSDSEHLPEALYESATSRYEKKDYRGARDLMDELRALDVNHPYEDEAWILDAFIDLAACQFPAADAKLNAFLKRYEPVRDAARRLSKDDAATRKLLEAVRVGADPAAAGTGVPEPVARALGALLRLDTAYSNSARRIAHVEHQVSGLRRAMQELDDVKKRLSDPKNVRAQHEGPLGDTPAEKVKRIEAQLAEVRRLIRETERAGKTKKGGAAKIDALKKELEGLEIRARAARAAAAPTPVGKEAEGKDLPGLISADRQRATRLHGEAEKLRARLLAQQLVLAKDALTRLDRRLSRLLARARLGRIETVLGRKRALEIEIEALSQGMLPQSAVDSLDAARYLRDDEEYWPFDGEDWEDEYVGGEGLR